MLGHFTAGFYHAYVIFGAGVALLPFQIVVTAYPHLAQCDVFRDQFCRVKQHRKVVVAAALK
jgi:hypothetical protein